MSNVVQNEEYINQVLGLIDSKNEEINKIFDLLDKKTAPLVDEKSDSSKFDIVLSAEFLIIRLRVILVWETSQIKHIISDCDLSFNLTAVFKKRESYLITVLQRMNELRDDLTVVQRSVYTKRTMKI